MRSKAKQAENATVTANQGIKLREENQINTPMQTASSPGGKKLTITGEVRSKLDTRSQ